MSPDLDPRLLGAALRLILRELAARSGLVVIGICGAQGSGKTTLARRLAEELAREGLAVASLSLDDLYLTRAERAGLAQEIHPLLATRGVPGTHDVALGMAVIRALEAGEAVPLPRFDKARDDRMAEADWPRAPARCRVLLLEGWCLGALPQDEAALAAPVNALEREEDADGRWRRHVNAQLAGPYAPLFARIDRLILLAAPSFDVVQGWRLQQEQELAAPLMDEAGIARFIQFYQRLTEHILQEMPARADLVIELGPEREVLSTG